MIPAASLFPPPDVSAVSCDRSPIDDLPLWREAAALWLEWNAGHETAIRELARPSGDLARLRDWLDQLDQIRWRAIELTQELLANSSPDSSSASAARLG